MALVCASILYDLGGNLFGYIPRASEEAAGYFMAASAFFGLADALRSGSHVRVTALSRALRGGAKRLVDTLAAALAALVAGAVAWFAAKLAWQSFSFGEVSQGLVAIPLWIPQSAMAAGAAAFFLAVSHRAFRTAAGDPFEPPESGAEGRP